MNAHRIELIEKRLDAIEEALGIQKPEQKVVHASKDNFAVVTSPHVEVTPELLTRCGPTAGVPRHEIVRILWTSGSWQALHMPDEFMASRTADAIQELIARAAIEVPVE